jgi:ArsR family transcriptional regulator, arsenate/arsenite/antimonite-responsive transcriptional repressor
MDRGAALLSVLADPFRWAAVRHLADPHNRREAPCGCGIRANDLQEAFGVTQPTVSYHMRRLVEAGVVRELRRSRCVFYELDADALSALADDFGRLAANARDTEGEADVVST